MKLKVFIPSYNREKTMQTHRLFTDRAYYDMYIVVHKEEHKQAYLINNPELTPEQILVSNRNEGILGQRLFIEEQVKEGEWYISADDDIESFSGVCSALKSLPEIPEHLCTKNNYSELYSQEQMYWELVYMIDLCDSRNCKLFGFAATDNHFFRKTKLNDCAFIIGQIFGEKKTSNLPTDKNVKVKEDYARTAKHILYFGNAIRNSFIRPKTKMYGAGGIGSLNQRLETLKQDAKHLCNEYEGLFRENTNRSNEGEVLINIRGKENIQKWRLKMIVKGKLPSTYAVSILGKDRAEAFCKKYNL